MRLSALIGLGALIPTPVMAGPVPFVGCSSDGQLGPTAAPRRISTPIVAGSAASQLAYYVAGDGVGVLAPRGWQCFGWAGSNGAGVVVAPWALNWNAIATRSNYRGPAVILDQISGSTSGRFEVARYAARAFPAAATFVAQVEAEGSDAKPFPRGPYPADKRTFRGPYQLLFTTPAGKNGLGTDAGLHRDDLPIDGALWLHPHSDMDLTVMAARLPRAMRTLVAEIIKQAAPVPKR